MVLEIEEVEEKRRGGDYESKIGYYNWVCITGDKVKSKK